MADGFEINGRGRQVGLSPTRVIGGAPEVRQGWRREKAEETDGNSQSSEMLSNAVIDHLWSISISVYHSVSLVGPLVDPKLPSLHP